MLSYLYRAMFMNSKYFDLEPWEARGCSEGVRGRSDPSSDV